MNQSIGKIKSATIIFIQTTSFCALANLALADSPSRSSPAPMEVNRTALREAHDREMYLEGVEARLFNLENELSSISQKSSNRSGDARQELDKRIVELRHDQEEARKNFSKLKANASSSDGWESNKKAVENQVDSIESDVNAALADLS